MTTSLQNLLARLLLLAALALTPAYGAEPAGIGVLAYRPKPQTLAAVLTGRADCAPATDLLKELRLPPFDTAPIFDLADLWHQYRPWIVAVFMLGLLLGAGANLLMQNRRIRQGEQRFDTLFDHSPEPMWIMVDRRFIDCNPAALRLFGFPDRAAMQGLGPLDISPECQPDGEASKTKVERLLQAVEKGIPQSFEWEHLQADGAAITCFIKLVPTQLNGKPAILCSAQDISARKQMEAALHDSNTFNISVLDSLSAQIAVLDAKGVIIAVNEAWRQFAKENGLPASGRAMSGANYLEACGDEASVRSGILSVLNGEKNAFHVEYPCHSSDQQRWFQMNVSPLQGSRHGVVVSHENITERLEHEHKLGLFHSLFELAADCMFLINPNQGFKFVFVNDATCRHFDATREQLLQWRLPDWDPNFKTQADLDALMQTVKHKQGLLFDTVHRVASGREIPVEISANYLSYDGEDYLAGYFHDITERRLVEQELKTSEAKFRSIIEASPVPMALNDDALNITFLNPAFVQTFGYTLTDIPNLAAWWQKAYPDSAYRQQAQTGWQISMETARREQAEFVPLELAICCKDNSVKTAMIAAAAINHDFSGVHLVILYDISERKKIEAELIRSNAELEQFAYAVSHDMRQPLRMVSSYLSLIENALAGKLDEDTRQCLDFALNGAKRMDAMILSLLDYSRIGRVFADKIRTSSQAALDEALAFLGPEISACGGAVKVSGEWPELLASPDELTRLLQNLIGNGLKYHRDEQPPQVDVHGEVCGTVLRVAVRDQGIGIAPNQTDRLFKVFSRLQARSRFEGTGVGLALCRKIVEHHDGSIGVESEGEGHGCLFWFELPL